MSKSLRARLERLEAKVGIGRVPPNRYGYIKELPEDYVGESHLVIVSSRMEGNIEWCEFEERPGPGPDLGMEIPPGYNFPAFTIASRAPSTRNRPTGGDADQNEDADQNTDTDTDIEEVR